MPCEIVVIGASAGGVEALRRVASELPKDFPVPICVVLHISADFPSLLPEILSRSGPLPAVHPKNGEAIRPGHIYIAPPDHHLLVKSGTLELSRGPKENRHRPAVDPLFRSAALEYGPRATGVVLTGNGDDGTSGLIAIKKAGGISIVQNPDEALYTSMPISALTYDSVDYKISLHDLVPLLQKICLIRMKERGAAGRKERPDPEVREELRKEVEVTEMKSKYSESSAMPESPRGTEYVGLSCPECGGPVYEIQEGKLTRFRCRVGHGFSLDSLDHAQREAVENALWAALQALDQQAEIRANMARRAERLGYKPGIAYYAQRAEESRMKAKALREILKSGGPEDEEAAPPVNLEESGNGRRRAKSNASPKKTRAKVKK